MNKFYIYATKRSGHHAIIEWMGEGIDRNVVFYNDMFLNDYENDTIKEKRYKVFLFGKGLISYEIYNFEDGDLSLNKFKGRKIIIVRDIYNTMASSIKKYVEKGFKPTGISKEDYFPELLRIWKQYCREILGETNFVGNKLFINFNQWSTSKQYRDKIANEIGFKNEDKTVDKISSSGLSSFNKGSAKGMKINERFWNYLDHPKFQMIDREAHKLNGQIFNFDIDDIYSGNMG